MTSIHPSKQELISIDTIDELNIRSRVCHLFIEDEKNKQNRIENIPDTEKICKCGYKREKHKDESEPPWSMTKNTYEKINPEYGFLKNKAPYVQLAPDTPLPKVKKILDAWGIVQPRFIASIIGGAKYFKLSNRLETNFIKGIVDIAQKSDAWLITNGYNAGITQVVGQAINKVRLTNPKQKITAIGISKRGCFSDFESQKISNNKKTEETTADRANNPRQKRRSGEWPIEMHHSHYLMLDDGTIRNFDMRDYRTKFAIYMASLQPKSHVDVPVVTIAVEGGKDTIANVYYDLKASIPVVLISGSGRAADFLSRWLLYTKDLENNAEDRKILLKIDEVTEVKEEKADPNKNQAKQHSSSSSTSTSTTHINFELKKLEKMFEKHEKHLENDVKDTLLMKDGKDDETPEEEKKKKVNLIARQVMYCLQPAVRSNITVFNLNSDDDLSETIFRSICRSRQKLFKKIETKRNDEIERNEQKSQSRVHVIEKNQKAERKKLLKLAMDWNCIDAAKELIFQNSLDNILNTPQLCLIALQKNLPTFVYQFLRLEISLGEVFNFQVDRDQKQPRYTKFIQALYKYDILDKKEKLHLKIIPGHIAVDEKKVSKLFVESVDTLNSILKTLIGDYMHKLYFETLEEEEKNRKDQGLWEWNRSFLEEERDKMTRDYMMRDLFIWSILLNRIEMAKVFLSYMEYRICPALIATKIFKKFNEIAPYGDLKDNYLESAKYFEKYAIDCLDKCNNRDTDKACEIILQRNELYGYITCLQVAADAESELFIATPCSVQTVKSVWYDKLHPEQNIVPGQVSLFIGFVSFGLVAPLFVEYRKPKFKKSEEKREHDLSDRRLRTNGINYSDPFLLERDSRPESSSVYKRYFHKLKRFHQCLPVKFYYHLITYCFFLLLFSYFLLFNFNPPTNTIPSINWTEILTIILVSCMLIEETYYFFAQDNLSWTGRVENYFRQPFKTMNFLGFLLFYIGLIVRFTYANSEENFTAARIIMAFDLEIWWLRTLSFVIVIPALGPNIVAIGKMSIDLIFFIFVIAIVMTAYGVASRSMVYYPVVNDFTTATGGLINTSFDGRAIFHQILYPVYYFLYGQFTQELANLDTNPNAAWSIATQVLLAFQMIFVNILLINLLIAMFSKRYDQVHDDTKNIWHFQQYFVTHEYYIRSPYFPPISLFCDIYYLCRMFFFFVRQKFFKKPAHYNAKVFQIIPEKDSIFKQWRKFENEETYEYAHNEVKTSKTELTKSTLGSDSNNKEKQESNDDNGNDANDAIEVLKQVEKDLIKLNATIEEMRANFKDKNKKDKHKSKQT